jgi:hypothetical protein
LKIIINEEIKIEITQENENREEGSLNIFEVVDCYGC